MSLFAVVFWPPVITFASPRPASIITSVLMNGCRPTTETRNPFTAPSRPATTIASPSARNADPAVFGAELRNSIATAPATAITEPTERSMPFVATTRHMPTAIIITGAAERRMSMRFPTRWPFPLTETARYVGSLTTLISSRSTMATMPQTYGRFRTCLRASSGPRAFSLMMQPPRERLRPRSHPPNAPRR